jgi:hypothetical protein
MRPTTVLSVLLVILVNCKPKPVAEIDYALASRYLRSIASAESLFFQTHGRYGSFDELWPVRSDPAQADIAAGTYDDFHFRLVVSGAGYEVTVWPASNHRRVSLYSDQSGLIRIAVGEKQADQTSTVLGPSR